MIQRDRKLNDMKQHLAHLEACLNKVELEDNRGSKKSKRQHSRREDSEELYSADSKKHRMALSRREGKQKEDL